MNIVIHLIVLLSELMLTAACSGSTDAPDPTPAPGMVHRYMNLTVQVASSRSSRAADGTSADEDDNYASLTAEERESAVSSITAIIYPAEADINDKETASQTLVRAFSWRVAKTESTTSGTIAYTTGNRELPSDLKEGDYKILVVANADLSSALDGTSLEVVREYIYGQPAYTTDNPTDRRYLNDPITAHDFVMASTEEVYLALMPIFGPITGGAAHGSAQNPYTPDSPITVERLAARIDLALDPSLYREQKDAEGNVTERGYEFPVVDNLGNRVGTYRLTHAVPFNLTREQYLFKHATTGTDESDLTVEAPGREKQVWSGGVLRAANYVIDPETFHQGNFDDIIGSYYVDYLYRENIGENATMLGNLYHVPRATHERLSPWTNSEGTEMKYYIMAYSAENTVLASAQESTNPAPGDFLPGIRFYGKYVPVGGDASTAREMALDYFIRHAGTTGKVDTKQPMALGLVRNNIYRIYIRSITSKGDDFGIKAQVNVLPWQYYEHSDIAM